MTTNLRIGYVQFNPRFGEPAWNRRKLAELVRRAPHADLLVLPELCFSGYHFENWQQAWALSEPATDNAESMRMLRTLADETGTTLVAGYNERDRGPEERLFNSAVMVVPRLGLSGCYRKVHLFNTEKLFFTAGNEFRLFDLPLRENPGSFARLGILICFDWAFTEAWRAMMLMGADVIAHPSNLVLPGKAQAAVPVMAMMNRMAVVTANRWGEERGLRFTGESLVAASDGTQLAHARPDADEVGIGEVSLQAIRNRQLTERNHLINDRRPDLYRILTEE